MQRIILKSIAVLLGIALSIGAFVMVLYSEQNKRNNKYILAQSNYNNLYSDWEKYQTDYTKQVEAIKDENRKEMLKAKAQYEDLLVKQPDLIKQNTKVVTKTQPSTQTQVTKQVQVQKPKSTPVTRSS
jgi:hypothetical protein